MRVSGGFGGVGVGVGAEGWVDRVDGVESGFEFEEGEGDSGV